ALYPQPVLRRARRDHARPGIGRRARGRGARQSRHGAQGRGGVPDQQLDWYPDHQGPGRPLPAAAPDDRRPYGEPVRPALRSAATVDPTIAVGWATLKMSPSRTTPTPPWASTGIMRASSTAVAAR